jgi:peptidoglycan/xylan/chitin deacetylase (PgdA/CDA1 family)
MLKILRSFVRKTIDSGLYWSGIGRGYEMAARPDGAIILMYHSIAPDTFSDFIDPRNRLPVETFDAQMAYLKRHRRVVPLSQVIDQITEGVSPPAGTVSITFDDGYLDNLSTAAPILEKYKLPATLFLATGYVQRGEAQWADRLHWLIRKRTTDKLRIPLPGFDEADLSSDTGRETLLRELHRYLLESTYDERKKLLDGMESQLNPREGAPRLTLNWDDVRELHRRYPLFDIGGHTREHIDLRKHRKALAQSEIDGCAEDLRRELGFAPRHFSFPYGRWCEETRQFVRDSGWQSATGINLNVRVDNASDRFAIPRVEAPLSMTELRFKTSGAYPGILSILGLGA